MTTMTTKEAVQEIRRLIGNAQVFGCTFKKKDGSIRTGSFRLGVKKGITGAGKAYDPDEYGHLTVWDMNRGGYRTIVVENIISIHIDGKEIKL